MYFRMMSHQLWYQGNTRETRRNMVAQPCLNANTSDCHAMVERTKKTYYHGHQAWNALFRSRRVGTSVWRRHRRLDGSENFWHSREPLNHFSRQRKSMTKTTLLNNGFISHVFFRQISASPCPFSAQTARRRRRDASPQRWGRRRRQWTRPCRPALPAPTTGTWWSHWPNLASDSRPLPTANTTSWTAPPRGPSAWPRPSRGPWAPLPARPRMRRRRTCPRLSSTLPLPPTARCRRRAAPPPPLSPKKRCEDPSRWERQWGGRVGENLLANYRPVIGLC